MLWRIQTASTLKTGRNAISRASIATLPRQSHSSIVLRNPTFPFHQANKIRSFKTSTLRLIEENSKPTAVKSEISIEQLSREQTAELYLDNVFPLRMGWFDFRQFLFRNSKGFLESKAHTAIPDELPYNFAIKEITARTKDGGAIVKFSFKSTDGKKVEVTRDIVERVNDHIKTNNIVAQFNFQNVRAFTVKGNPFLEDLIARYPTQRLRIEFQGEPVNVERLYAHLRPYGKIFDIALYPSPLASKDPARYAVAQFTRVRFATSARNCLHGHYIDGTRMNILYERQLHTNVVKDWLVNHPRITIPLVAAIFAGITYIVFDPLRVFFITSKVTQRFNPQEYAIYRWLRNETWDRIMPRHDPDMQSGGAQSLWADDAEKTEQLKSWLAETPETFVLVTGHKGSGKSALIKSAIKDRRNKIFIDCTDLTNSRNKSEMTKNLAKEVGYFPVFTWASSMGGLIDTVVAATTGQKANLSSNPDSQIKDILETVAIALRDIVPSEKEERHREEEASKRENILERFKSIFKGQKIVAEIEASIKDEKSIENEEEEDIKMVPIVVIDNYMYRETAKNSALWEELAEWAALLIENGIAHVVFVSSNASVMKTLGKSLPGKSFSTIALSDATPEMAMSFIHKELGSEMGDEDLLDVVAALGGRLTELELLVQKMKMKMDAHTAFEDIVTRNLIEIRKYGFGDSSDSENKLDWTPTQFWTIVKQLTNSITINYDELRWNPAYNGDETSLRAMERAELITISFKNGRPNSIRPGKPVFYTVFNRLVEDTVFAASMEIETNMTLKKQSEADMTKLEDVINKLSNINNTSRPPKEIEARIKYLLTKVTKIEKLLEEYDANISSAKDLISKTWKEDEL